ALLQRPLDVHVRAQHGGRNAPERRVRKPDRARARRPRGLPVRRDAARQSASIEPGADGSRHELPDPPHALPPRPSPVLAFRPLFSAEPKKTHPHSCVNAPYRVVNHYWTFGWEWFKVRAGSLPGGNKGSV